MKTKGNCFLRFFWTFLAAVALGFLVPAAAQAITMTFDACSGSPLCYTEGGMTVCSRYPYPAGPGDHIHCSSDLNIHGGGCCSSPYEFTYTGGCVELKRMDVTGGDTDTCTTFTAATGASVCVPWTGTPYTFSFPPGFRVPVLWDSDTPPDGANPYNTYMIIDNLVYAPCQQQACTNTAPVPTAPTNVGTFPPDGMLHYDPMLMRPFDLDDLGGNYVGTLMLPCWKNGMVDIYLVVSQSPYGQLIMNNFHQWLAYPANLVPWKANTTDALYVQLFSYLKSTVAAGTYHLDVVVVPSGTPASAIPGIVAGTATGPYYKWRFTKTLP